jgi:hypothetical protein
MENNKTSFHKFMDATQGVNVELGLMDDIKSLIGKYKSLDDAIKTQSGKAFTAVKTYQESVLAAYQNAQNAIDLIIVLDNKSKELGLPDSGMGGYKKELSAKASEYKSKFGKIDGILKSL